MFEQNSRYFHLGELRYQDENGFEIVYKKRRFLPQEEDLPPCISHKMHQSERLDQFAARTLGSAEYSWKVADMNQAMDLADLEQAKLSLRVPLNGTGAS